MFFGTTDLCLNNDHLHYEKNWAHMSGTTESYGRLVGRQNRDEFQNF